MKAYSVQVRSNGKTEITEFDSIHSANRMFASYIVDYGIDYVLLIDNINAVEIGKWVNTNSPVMIPTSKKKMLAIMYVNHIGNRVYVRRSDDCRKAATFTTDQREAAEIVAASFNKGEVVEIEI